MKENEIHILKRISGWHYVYIIIILVLVIIGITSYNYSQCSDFVALVSFAATISSIILSVLAIIFTVVSGESTNRVRDGLIELQHIPNEVNKAIESTIGSLRDSANKLSQITEENKASAQRLKDEFKDNISMLEKHIQQKLNEHSSDLSFIKNKLSANNSNRHQRDVTGSVSELINGFVSTTSSICLMLLKAIDIYCKHRESTGKDPIADISEISRRINNDNEDEAIDMYLWACLVLMSSMHMIRYESMGDTPKEVKFFFINQEISNLLDDELKTRNYPYDESWSVTVYINSLFNIDGGNDDESKVN